MSDDFILKHCLAVFFWKYCYESYMYILRLKLMLGKRFTLVHQYRKPAVKRVY